jgi:hypothetical protein
VILIQEVIGEEAELMADIVAIQEIEIVIEIDQDIEEVIAEINE